MSLKFKQGDRFKVQSSYDPNFKQRGVIKAVSFNSVHQNWEYVVKWDHIPGEHGYECIEVENIWEKNLDFNAIDSVSVSYTIKNSSNKCTHQWVKYVGFTDIYEYCKLCDAKRSDV